MLNPDLDNSNLEKLNSLLVLGGALFPLWDLDRIYTGIGWIEKNALASLHNSDLGSFSSPADTRMVGATGANTIPKS